MSCSPRPFRVVCKGVWQWAVALVLGAGSLSAETISGYVLDAQNDVRLADVEVAFLVAGEAGLSEMVRHRTDEEGVFAFSGPFLTTGTSFVLVAHYAGLEYATDALEAGAQDEVIIEVFDGTEDESQIRIDGHHLFLAITEAGIDVAQLVHIDNLSPSTYMGRNVGDSRQVFQLQVPDGATALQGHSGQLFRASPSRLFTDTPLPPGRSQISFTVQLAAEDFSGVYEHEVLYPTARLELFLQPSDIELPAALFEDLGEIQLHDQQYRHYRIPQLSPGRTVAIPLPFSPPLRWVLKWGMAAFVLALLAFALSMTRRTETRSRGMSPDEEKQALIVQLAGIDDRLVVATGADTEALRQQRSELKERLVGLYRRLS